MGSAQDIMKTFAEMDIHAVFSEKDGWTCTRIAGTNTSGILYQLYRDVHWKNETAVLYAMFDTATITEGIRQLAAVNGAGHKTVQKYLLVPQNTDLSAVPKEIRVLFMHAYGFAEGRLVWLTKKKNAVRYPVSLPASV